MTIGVWVHLWIFNSIQLIYLPVTVLIPCSFYHYCSIVKLEVRDGDSQRNSFIVLFLLSCFCFCFVLFFVIPDEVENCSFYLCEELSWTFGGDFIESVDCSS